MIKLLNIVPERYTFGPNRAYVPDATVYFFIRGQLIAKSCYISSLREARRDDYEVRDFSDNINSIKEYHYKASR